MCASDWVSTRPRRTMNVKARTAGPRGDPVRARAGAAPGRADRIADGSYPERTRWDPKDGELCLARTKPEETLVEVRSNSDVQIDCLSWV